MEMPDLVTRGQAVLAHHRAPNQGGGTTPWFDRANGAPAIHRKTRDSFLMSRLKVSRSRTISNSFDPAREGSPLLRPLLMRDARVRRDEANEAYGAGVVGSDLPCPL
jgi:hypothetical protein